MAVGGITYQKDPADAILGDLPNGYLELARASNVRDIQFQRKGGESIQGIGNDPKPFGLERRHHDHNTRSQLANGEGVCVGPTFGVHIRD